MTAKKANAYDDLNELHQTTLGLVTELEGTVQRYRAVADQLPEKRTQLDELVSTIERDATSYKGQIEKIYAEHKDWQGRPKRPNRFMECHSIGNDYLNILTSITNATLPIAADVISAMTEGATQ